MKRTKNTNVGWSHFHEKEKYHINPDLILCADIHLREDTPVCRTDDFQKAQWDKMDFICALQKQYNCPVVHSGDLFHHWKPSPELLSETIFHLPEQFYTVYGNHDLPQHNLDLAKKSGIYTLQTAGKLTVLEGTSWGQEPVNSPFFSDRKILVWHIMTYQGKEPWPGCTDPMAGKLLRKYPEYDLILTGDNHKTFTEEHEGRILANPGSMTRQTASQLNHRPSVFLYYAKTNTVKRVELPFNPDVISRTHLEATEQRDERIDSFISKLDTDWKASMSFEENLEIFRKKNNVKPSIIEIILKATES